MIRTLATDRFTSHAAQGAYGSIFSFSGILNRIAAWSAVARQRRQLAQLDAESLRDIGLTRDDVEIETARPFWDAPVHWRRDGHF